MKPFSLLILSFVVSAVLPHFSQAAESRFATIQALQDAMIDAIQTSEPYAASSGGSPVFHTNFDWHSSVHAHWALLSSARVTGDASRAEFVRSRLTDTALRKDRKYLAKHPDFEMPYGRAWLLMLLSELSRQPGGLSLEALRLQAETQDALLNYLRTHPLPEAGTRFIASHTSWLLAYWLFQMSHPSAPILRQLAELSRSKIDPARPLIPKQVYGNYDFLYLPAVMALIDRDPSYPVDQPPPLKPPFTIDNAHTVGAAAVRMWPFAMDCSFGSGSSGSSGASGASAQACQIFDSRLNDFLSHPERWRENFENLSHWIPQFLWMGIWLEQGAP